MRIWTVLLHSYVFWVFFSLINYEFLGFLSVPLLNVLMLPRVLSKFPFLHQLIVPAAGVAAIVALAAGLAARRWMRASLLLDGLTYLFHGTFVLVLLHLAEHERSVAMTAALQGRNPDCVELRTFIGSLKKARDPFAPHGLLKEGGKTFYWSYSTMRFFEGHPDLDRNFSCTRK